MLLKGSATQYQTRQTLPADPASQFTTYTKNIITADVLETFDIWIVFAKFLAFS